MSVGVLLMTHEAMGKALIMAAQHVLGRLSLPLDSIEVRPDADLQSILHEAAQKVRLLDRGEGVLVLTDLYGSTPSNLADKLATLGLTVHRVSGLNLPMLLRVMNYAEQPLTELMQTAMNGGRAGIVIDHA